MRSHPESESTHYPLRSSNHGDDGQNPQFSSEEIARFAQKYDFEHVTSSPHYPKSNGKVESAVKSAKRMLKKTRESGADQYLALLDIRNTPTMDLPSPAEPSHPHAVAYDRSTAGTCSRDRPEAKHAQCQVKTSRILEPQCKGLVSTERRRCRQDETIFCKQHMAEMCHL